MKPVLIILSLSALLLTSCGKEDIDQEKPVINLDAVNNFPQNCDTLWLGESFTFSALFVDNHELGSFSIEIHENFDHHAHSTESEVCELMPEKEPVNPFQFLQDYEIPSGLHQYEANLSITLPASDNNGPTDEGDYHFFISLTDRAGWSTQKGIAIKVLQKPSPQQL